MEATPAALTSFDQALERPRFVDRQRLTADDLERTTAYVRERLRRHNRYLHGWGVVCGAQVRRADAADPWEVEVSEGYLVTPGGAEVFVPPGLRVSTCEGVQACVPDLGTACDPDQGGGEVRETECVTFDEERRDVDLTRRREARAIREPLTVDAVTVHPPPDGTLAVATVERRVGIELADGMRIEVPDSDRVELTVMIGRAGLMFGGYVFEALAASGAVVARRAVKKVTPAATSVVLTGFGMRTVRVRAERAPAGLLLGVCYRRLPEEGEPRTVYLVAEPEEAPVCPRALVPPRCGPAGVDLEPVRIREGLRLSVRCALPDSHREGPNCDDLADRLCGRAHTPCPPSADDEAVVLATLRVTSAGVVGVDDLTDRRLLPSEALLHAFLQCQCTQLGEPPQPGTIVGTVREGGQNSPLPGVTVLVQPSGDEGEARGTVTDLEGRFTVGMLAPGSYLVRASVAGLRGTTVGVDVRAGETASVTLVLRSQNTGGGGVDVIRDPDRVRDPGLVVGGTDIVVEEIDRDLLDIIGRGEVVTPVVITDRIEGGGVVDPPEPGVVTERAPTPVVVAEPSRAGGRVSPGGGGVTQPVLFFSGEETDLERGRTEGTRAVEGVGATRERALREAGIDSVLSLATSPPGRVASALNVSLSRAAALRGAAVSAMRRPR